MYENCCLKSFLSVDCHWKASNETKYCSLLKNIKNTFFVRNIFLPKESNVFHRNLFLQEGFKSSFSRNWFWQIGPFIRENFLIDVYLLITNITFNNDSLMPVIFTFLHFARNFDKTLEIPSENKFSRISYFVYVKEYFLDLFYRKTKTLQFELKICKNYPL